MIGRHKVSGGNMQGLITAKAVRETAVGTVLAVLCSAALWGQSTVEVRCVDGGGNPVNGIVVQLKETRDTKIQDKKTNKQGIANFNKLVKGFYRIWVRAEGYAPALKDLVEVDGASTVNVDLTLKQGNFEEPMYFDNEDIVLQANNVMAEAVEAYSAGDLQESEDKLKKSIALFPIGLDARHNLGLLYMRMERWEEAEKTLQETIDLMDTYLEMGQTGLTERKQDVMNAIRSIPVQKVGLRANALMEERRFEEAIPLFIQMSGMVPDNADVFYNLALACAHADRIPDAKQHIAKAIELRNDDPAYKRLQEQIIEIEETGRSLRAQEAVKEIEKLYESEKYEEVLSRAEQAMSAMGEAFQPALWTLAARSQAQLGHVEQAVEAYRKGIALQPDNLPRREEMAAYSLANNLHQPAISAYEELFKAKSMPLDESFFKLAQDQSRQGNAEAAGLLLEKVLELNSDFAEVHYELGMYYFYEKQDRVKAKKFLQRYVEVAQDAGHKDNAQTVLIVMEKTKQ